MLSFALHTDLYELTMAQVYFKEKKFGKAVFSLFVRKLPPNRNFLVSCGLETLVERIQNFRFTDRELKYLKSLGIFEEDFLDYLESFSFSGDLYAIEEGRVVFQNEPMVQIEAPLIEAQMLETLVINTIHFQTLIASKAVRSFLVSQGKQLIDFGLRRAHGLEAGLYAARASYVAGFAGTSNLEAGLRFGIPVFGTMAHSFVMIYEEEEEAFRAFAKVYPERTILLIDTYDTIEGAKKAIKLMKEGYRVVGVRIDSGDLKTLSKEVRRLFDQEGFNHVKIVVSGGLDEYDIQDLLSSGCPIDAFGVGTKFITSSDSPYLDIAYKLVEYEGKPKYKTSPGKATFPYKRQVIREYEGSLIKKDLVVRYKEGGLVKKIMEKGKLVESLPSLEKIKQTLMEDLKSLPDELKGLQKAHFTVEIID
ncbi:nicotinate phosphoribosyltransferase [Thermocrinis minervae]|uniref:Nicotinate phosphoribosyltransferase n=1 Tax=Thermocrinis minervae TaxID=381751 RepID=A0A1M6RVD2_9AQUI|nr:nicotinate phosphoribosyltransferase [Thermocrinis minervae]SHK36348.1 nicotinate phosphoribosyltransferase [Thermocrinis minervae]